MSEAIRGFWGPRAADRRACAEETARAAAGAHARLLQEAVFIATRALLCICLVAVLAGALWLRVENNGFGLPHAYHPDEPLKVKAIDGLLHGGGPSAFDYFHHPFLLLLSTLLALAVRELAGPAQGDSLVSIQVAGRTAVALYGTATVLLVFFVARDVAGRLLRPAASGERETSGSQRSGAVLLADLAGVLAASILAVLPLHVACSHYIKEDVPLAFWVTLSAWYSARVARDGRRRDYILAALSAGLAVSTKYVGIICLPVLYLSHLHHRRERIDRESIRAWLRSAAGGRNLASIVLAISITAFFVVRKHAPHALVPVAAAAGIASAAAVLRWRRALARNPGAQRRFRTSPGARLVALAAAVFLLTNPFILMDPGRFGRELDYEMRHGVISGHRGVRVSPWRHGWTFHLRRSLIPGMTAPAAAASIAALLFLWPLRRKDAGIRSLCLAALVFYGVHEASYLKPPPNYQRYMVPVLPFAAVAWPVASIWLLAQLRLWGRATRTLRTTVLIGSIATGLSAMIGARAYLETRNIVAHMVPDTRDLAIAWCLRNIPAGASVLSTAYGPPLSDVGPAFEVRTLDTRARFDLRAFGPLSFNAPSPIRNAAAGAPTFLTPGVDYFVTSSLFSDRLYEFGPEELSRELKEGVEFYEALEKEWGPRPPVASFASPAGRFAFHNPKILVYRRPGY
ncbi:MAG: glycosyltransferase family 39 protein [bacterium]